MSAAPPAGGEALGDDIPPNRSDVKFHWERILSDLVWGFDALLVLITSVGTVSSIVALKAYLRGVDDEIHDKYYLAAILAVLVIVRVLTLLGAYDAENLTKVRYQLSRILYAWAIWASVFLACAFLAKSSLDFSRVWLVVWGASNIVAFLVSRLVLAQLIKSSWSKGLLRRNVAIVGASQQGLRLADRLMAEAQGQDRVLAFFDDRSVRVPPSVRGVPVITPVDKLVEFARRNQVHRVVIALPWSAEERVLRIIETLNVLPVDIYLSPDLIGLRFSERRICKVGRIQFLEAASCPITDWQFVVKQIEDKVIAAMLLLLLLPLFVAVAIAIKLTSKGPVLFKQKRYGFNNQLITVYKFRSMYVDRMDVLADRLVTRNDPRVTPIGALLRKTSLDELPQLLNVLRGDMSLVGPRPHALNAKAAECPYEQAVRHYAVRHKVRPGMTGWAQVNGWRGETDTIQKIQQRVSHDLFYIENWSLWLDLKILLLTPRAVLSGRAAY